MAHILPDSPAIARAFKILGLLLILLTIINVLVIVLLPDTDKRLILSDAFFILLGFALLACLRIAASESAIFSQRAAVAWNLLFVAHLSYVLADCIWAYYEIVLHVDPFPSVADGFYLAYYVFFFIGILFMMERTSSVTRGIHTWLDIALVFVSIFMLLWIFIIVPLIENIAGESLLVQSLNLAYPIGDLLLLSALLILIFKRSASLVTRPLVLLALSLYSQIITDLVFSFQNVRGVYISGGLTDIGWVFSYAFAGFAALSQASMLGVKSKPVISLSVRSVKTSGFFSAFRNGLPYLVAAFVLAFMQVSYANGLYTDQSVLVVGAWAIVLIVLFRQYLALQENAHLGGELQSALAQVQVKAQSVEKVNARLRTEIRSRKKLEEELKHTALHDPLTGLPNRALFFDRLEHALALTKRDTGYFFSIFFVDLDRFKQVNDNLGHARGDEVLVQFSQALLKTLRSIDTLARLGGDEFALLVENTPSRDALMLVAERIRACARMSFKARRRTVHTSASVGLVFDPRGYESAAAILHDADQAMYQAKTSEDESLVIFDSNLFGR